MADQLAKKVTIRVIPIDINFRVRSIINILGNLNTKYLKQSLIMPKFAFLKSFIRNHSSPLSTLFRQTTYNKQSVKTNVLNKLVQYANQKWLGSQELKLVNAVVNATNIQRFQIVFASSQRQ